MPKKCSFPGLTKISEHEGLMNLIVQNVNIFSKELGKGKPILFLHGVPDSADMWQNVVEGLQSNFRCLTPDWPGFGRSGPGDSIGCSLNGHADFVKELADALGLRQPFYLVAHDFGGISAMAFTSKYPERVRRLVISNAPFSPDYRWHFLARIWRTPGLGELSMATMNRLFFSIALRLGSRKLSKQHIMDAYRYLSPEMKRMILRLYRAIPEESWQEWHPKLLQATSRIPTLILWGEHDPFLPNWLPERYGAREIKRFSDAGHWVPVEESAAFIEDLQRFFR
jgi:pimeloyl-ACP methyl ester carboxylesterase